MKNIKCLVLLFICSLLFTACGTPKPVERKITPFSFTNQEGQSYGSEDLAGTMWIANFIFTNCTTVCPPMTAEMAALQQKFKDDGISVQFVSFTVDPTVDTPETLKSYAEKFTDNLSNWHLLTGYSQNEIEIFAREQFQTIVQKPLTSSQVIHSTNFYLIDQDGVLVNEYNYIDATYVEEMIKDIKER